MSYTFDGANKLIILPTGMNVLDVKDMYSRWKEWVCESDNSKYLPFFEVVGGDVTIGSNAISSYFFLRNGAKIRPYEGNHTLRVDGILIGEDGGDAFSDTVGSWRVRIVQVIPMQAETIAVSGEGGNAPTAQQVADAVWNFTK
jgi:hypothetical protein